MKKSSDTVDYKSPLIKRDEASRDEQTSGVLDSDLASQTVYKSFQSIPPSYCPDPESHSQQVLQAEDSDKAGLRQQHHNPRHHSSEHPPPFSNTAGLPVVQSKDTSSPSINSSPAGNSIGSILNFRNDSSSKPTSASRSLFTSSGSERSESDKTFLLGASDQYNYDMEQNGKAHDGYGVEGGTPYNSKTQIVSNGGSKQPTKGGNVAFVYFLSCFATIGGLLFGYDTGIVSGSMLLIQPHFNLDTIWQEVIVSGTIAAAAVFALIAGFTCDFFGRKKTIMMASFIFAGGAVVMAVAPDKEVLLAGRIIVGAGIGFASMTVPVYVAEAAPPEIRGRLVTLNQLFITIGILLSSIIAGAFSTMKPDGWRYMLGLAAVPGVIQFLGFICLPESPRWLISKNRDDEAREVLRRIRGVQDVEAEVQEMKEGEAAEKTDFVLGRMLRTPHVRKALFMGCGLQFFQQLCGVNTVIYYSATILKMSGFPPDVAIWLVCVPNAVNFLATFIGLWAVEKLGRRLLLIISLIGVSIALLVLALGFQLSAKFSPPVNATQEVFYVNGSEVSDHCISSYSICEDCILNKDCGYCQDHTNPAWSRCLRAQADDQDLHAEFGKCSSNYSNTLSSPVDVKWSYGYCPTDYTWMAVLGLALFVLAFAPGLGPMPWTINSEIYPMWARGTGNAVATAVNWLLNLVVSFTFLTLTESITKYGTFWLFCGICLAGLLFTLIFVPETKNKSLEEVEEMFMTPALREQRQRERETVVSESFKPDSFKSSFDTRL